MTRKTIDPSHAELNLILSSMLEADEDIAARAVARNHSTLKNASDITRHAERRALLDAAKAKQLERRKWVNRVKSTGTLVAAEKIQATEERISAYEADEAARIASHLAMIHAVAEMGGTAKLLKFYQSYAEVRDRLYRQGALPAEFLVEVDVGKSPR
jgi:fumarylacetoacetate (FAA) hydrolase family protein